jgi:hypothetical protein
LNLRRNATTLVVIVILFHHTSVSGAQFAAVFGGNRGSNGDSRGRILVYLLLYY